jgi:hypothetical protein
MSPSKPRDYRAEWLSETISDVMSAYIDPDATGNRRALVERALELHLGSVSAAVLARAVARRPRKERLGVLERPDLWTRAVELAEIANSLPVEQADTHEYERRQVSNRWFEAETGASLDRDLVLHSDGKGCARYMLVCEVLIVVPKDEPQNDAFATLWGPIIYPAGVQVPIRRYRLGDVLGLIDEDRLSRAELGVAERAREQLRRGLSGDY